MIKHIVL